MSHEPNENAGAERRATERVSWWVGGSVGDNGEAVCRRWEEMVEEKYAEILFEIENGAPSDETTEHVAYVLAADLKEWCEDEIGDEPRTGLVGELLGYMLACV